MDSWSRPGKHSAVPPPLYSTQGDSAKYCQTCGRIMSSAAKAASTKTEDKKYCSSRCRSQKPGPQDRRIENAFVRLLMGDAKFEDENIPEALLGKRSKPLKGDPRVIVPCSVAEELIYGSRHDPTKTSGRKKNRASRVIGDEDEDLDDKSEDLVPFTTQGFAGKVHDKSDSSQARRKCEAIMQAKVVEPSFAKGDWGIRWRE